jgi:hypothetical protein
MSSYAFQCIASESLTDRMLHDLTFLRVRSHRYKLYEETFTMTTSYSKSPVHARLYLYETNNMPDTIPTDDAPFVIVFFGDKNSQLESWKKQCIDKHIPFFHRSNEKDTREIRDEMYVLVISWLITLSLIQYEIRKHNMLE